MSTAQQIDAPVHICYFGLYVPINDSYMNSRGAEARRACPYILRRHVDSVRLRRLISSRSLRIRLGVQ